MRITKHDGVEDRTHNIMLDDMNKVAEPLEQCGHMAEKKVMRMPVVKGDWVLLM